MSVTLHSPSDTRGWKVVEGAAGRVYLSPDGTGYRELARVQREDAFAAKPDVVITYRVTERETWLKQLGPRQLEDRLKGKEE